MQNKKAEKPRIWLFLKSRFFYSPFLRCAGHGTNLTGESPVRVNTYKCSKPQAVNSNVMGEERG